MPNEKFSFELLKEDGFSRLGKINTHRGEIDTPTFMPVGTRRSVRTITSQDLE